MHGAMSVTLSAIENTARRQISASALPGHLAASIPLLSMQHTVLMSATFASYEMAKHRALRALVGRRAEHTVVSPLSEAGIVCICTGSLAAGSVQFALSHWISQLSAPRAGLSMMQYAVRLVPPPVACLYSLPAQVLGFLAFEYGKVMLVGSE